jgi:hypothetical protein
MDELLTYRQCVVCAHCISNGNCPTSQKSCTVDACAVRDTCRNQRSKQATCRTQSDKCAAAALNRTEQQRVGDSSGTVACLPCAEVPASDIRWSIRPRAVSAVGRLWCEVHSKVSSVQCGAPCGFLSMRVVALRVGEMATSLYINNTDLQQRCNPGRVPNRAARVSGDH